MTALARVSVLFVDAGICIRCGIPMALPEFYMEQRRKDHQSFHCLNGHPQCYPQETVEERLKRELANETKRREWAEQETKRARHAESIARGKTTALRERVSNGVCPCCNRSFTNLRRHMASKHPTYKTDET